MIAKIEEKKKAQELRKEGKSLGEISQILKVSKGSVSAWVKNIKITEEQKIRLVLNSRNGSSALGVINSERYRILRQQYQEDGRALARLRDPDFFAGCMLYWAEGSKSRVVLQMTNSDSDMLKYFITFLIKFFNIKNEDIVIYCNYYSNNNLTNIDVENYWLNKLDLPEFCLRKTVVNKMARTSCIKRQERTKYGVARVTVYDVRIIQMIYGAIQEIASFYNKEWVDAYLNVF